MLLKSLLGAVQWLWFMNDVHHSENCDLLTLQSVAGDPVDDL